MKKLSLLPILFLYASTLFAQVELPALFSDNMVFQQQYDCPVWGWAEPGESIVVKGSWANEIIKTITNKDGKWMLKLQTTKAGGPYFVTINDDTLHNVMIGEVWICSGQSNMQWALSQTDSAEQEIEKAEFPDIRLFYVARDNADEPSKDCYGKWVECKPESARTFSAVAYYFGKELHSELNVPMGLIHVSWGGSTVQAWTNYNILQSTPEGRYYIEKYKEKIVNTSPGFNPRDNQSPSGLYNGMLKPLIPFGIRGAIWYQGEANTSEHYMYKNLKNTMITNWRNEWGQGDFPFYFVQLAPFNYQKDIIGAALRDEQRRTLEISNTGMAVTMDIGNPDDIHPVNKKDVGKRLALWALAKTYGKEEFVYSGPLYKSMKDEGMKIRLFFDHVGNGLVCKGKNLTHFTIAGEERKFYPAYARIERNTIVVSAKNVKSPVAVRYAFNNGDEPNLFNKEGLPASTFRTDDWKIITETASILSEYNSDNGVFMISIEPKPESEVRYTLDGSEPSIESEKYLEPFSITDNVLIKAKVFVDGEPSLIVTETKVVRHLATGKKVTYKDKYHERYTGGGDLCLVNSIFGSTNFKDGNWQGFNGKDMEVVIDLNNHINVSEVRINCLQLVNSWIVLPKQIEIYVSDDGQKFIKMISVENEISVGVTEELIHEFKIQFETVETKYIKVIAKNYGPLPEWHQSAGNDSWLFVDEIFVE